MRGGGFGRRACSPLAEADGFTRAPLYWETQGERAAPPPTAAKLWGIAQRITPDARGANNASVLADVEGGVNILLLDFAQCKTLPDTAALQKLLHGVMLDAVRLSLAPAQYGVAACTASAPLAPTHYNYDPLGAHILHEAELTNEVAKLLELANADASLMTANGAAYYAAGANIVQELAWAFASIAEYLRTLTQNGLPPTDALPRITLTLAADVDIFATLAKCRAARLMYASIAAAIGATAPLQIHCETSLRGLTNAEAMVNILRGTSAAMGAGLGGADVICVAPATAASEQDSTLTRRMARNTQLILQEESHLAQVADPAGGSAYIESMTQDLANKAWGEFQSIEKNGGMWQAVAGGEIAATLTTQRTKYAADNLVGVSIFPNAAEKPLGDGARPDFRLENIAAKDAAK